MIRKSALGAFLLFVTFTNSLLCADRYTFTHFAGPAGGPGFEDGTGSAARFNRPQSIAVDGAGNLFIADSENNTIRKITPDGVVATLAGVAGLAGRTDGRGSIARFNKPSALTIDNSGNVFVSDWGNSTIRKITPQGQVTTLAGSSWGSMDGSGINARFARPRGITCDAGGNLYVADTENYTIRKVTPEGVVTTIAGLAGVYGSADGVGSSARFSSPSGVAVDGSGNVIVGDYFNHTIRRITPLGEVTTLAGAPGISGTWDGGPFDSRFRYPGDVKTDGHGNVYVADSGNALIRKVTSEGMVTTVPVAAGLIVDLTGIALGSDGTIYAVDATNQEVLKVSVSGQVTKIAGLRAAWGCVDGTGAAARFLQPRGIAKDGDGNLWLADSFSQVIRKITPAGVVTTVAGNPLHGGSKDGTGSTAEFGNPNGIAIASDGTIFVADQENHTIRKITPQGVVTTFAGVAGQSGEVDGQGSGARLSYPGALAIDSTGNLFVADGFNVIRRITPDAVVTTYAGKSGVEGSADGPAADARFAGPAGLAVASNGDLYVADSGNATIRKITPAGMVSTVVGRAGTPGSADGVGTGARLYHPAGLAFDEAGSLYVCDLSNSTIRRVAQDGTVVTLGGRAGALGSRDGTGSEARFMGVTGIVASSGTIWFTETENNAIRVGRPALADVASIDAATGEKYVARQLQPSPQTASSYEWSIIRRPAGSIAQLSSTTSPNVTFTPDVQDLYVFSLTAIGSNETSITTVNLNVNCTAATATVSGTAPMCPSASAVITATMTGTPPWTITWSDGVVQSGASPSDFQRSVRPLWTTTYWVTKVENSCGTGSAMGAATITVTEPPNATVSGSATIQPGDSATIHADLTGTPPWTLVWSDGVIQSVGSSPAGRPVNPSESTNYTIARVQDASCPGGSSGGAFITVSGSPAIGPNFLKNANFEHGAAEWCPPWFSCSWNSLMGNSSGAGSLFVWNASTTPATFYRTAVECVDLPPADLLSLAASYTPGAGNAGAAGRIRASAVFYPNAGCSGTAITPAISVEHLVPSDTFWQSFEKTFERPAAASAQFSVFVGKDLPAGTIYFMVDDVFLGPPAAEPRVGKRSGGTSVTIRGTGFENGAAVTFGNVAASNVTFVDSTKLLVTTPPGDYGSVDVTVTNPNLKYSTAPYAFTYGDAGDLNGDRVRDSSDIFYLVNFLFAGGDGPRGVGDVNGDGLTNVTDLFFLVNYIYASGPVPNG